MSDADMIDDILRTGLASTLANPARIRRDKAIDLAFDLSGRLKADALSLALSIPLALDVAGALAIGTDIGPARWAPQAVTLWQVRARVRTAPVGGECTLWVAADGARVAPVTIQAGATSGVSSVSADLDPGALLTLDATAVNGAADLSVQLALRPRGD